MLEPTVNGVQAAGRAFPWFCPKCRQKEVRPATIPYHAERLWDGHVIAVDIPELEVPKCTNCGELVFNYTAEEQILQAVQAHMQAPASVSERPLT
jgi:hypothetical protein